MNWSFVKGTSKKVSVRGHKTMDRRDASLWMCHVLNKLDVVPDAAYGALKNYFKDWGDIQSSFMKNVITQKMRKHER